MGSTDVQGDAAFAPVDALGSFDSASCPALPGMVGQAAFRAENVSADCNLVQREYQHSGISVSFGESLGALHAGYMSEPTSSSTPYRVLDLKTNGMDNPRTGMVIDVFSTNQLPSPETRNYVSQLTYQDRALGDSGRGHGWGAISGKLTYDKVEGTDIQITVRAEMVPLGFLAGSAGTFTLVATLTTPCYRFIPRR